MNIAHPANTKNSPKPRTTGTDRYFWLILTAILVIAAALRSYRLGEPELWLDELHAMANSAGHREELDALLADGRVANARRAVALRDDSTSAAVWHTMSHDSHPPLFFLLLLGWRRLWGDGEATVRSLAACFSVLSIIPVALIGRALGQARVGLAAALLLTFAFAHLFMGQDGRPYSLATLLTCASYYFLLRIEAAPNDERPRTRWTAFVLYGLSLYLAVLTHYFAATIALGQAAYALYRLRGPALRRWLITVSVAATAAAVTWGAVFLQQLDFIRSQSWLLERKPDHAWRTWMRFADLPVRLMIPCVRFQLNYAHSVIGAMVLLLCPLWLYLRGSRCLPLFAAWYVVPVVLFTVLDLATGMHLLAHLRYSAVVVPGLVIGLAVMIDRFGPNLQGLAWGVMGIALLAHLRLPAAENPEARPAAHWLRAHLTAKDLLIYDAVGWPPEWVEEVHLVPLSYYLDELPCPFLFHQQTPSPGEQARIAAHDRIMVVSPRVDAIPHPAPATHELVFKSGHLREIGWIYVFTRTAREKENFSS